MSSILLITATQGSNPDAIMQDAYAEDKKVKDVVQKKLGVSTGAITKPKTIHKREKPQVHPPAVQPPQRPQASPSVVVQDNEEGDLLGRFGRLIV
jgi:hypothetical protein